MLRRLIVVLAAAGALAVPAAASAHVEVSSTSPSGGSTASRPLGSVSVTFTGALRSGSLKVKRIGGGKASRGKGGRDPRNISRLRAELKRGLSAGKYRARWKVVSADGHEQKGSFTFRLT